MTKGIKQNSSYKTMDQDTIMTSLQRFLACRPFMHSRNQIALLICTSKFRQDPAKYIHILAVFLCVCSCYSAWKGGKLHWKVGEIKLMLKRKNKETEWIVLLLPRLSPADLKNLLNYLFIRSKQPQQHDKVTLYQSFRVGTHFRQTSKFYEGFLA